ncbi:hypothetical protein BIV57_21500 [Mangrovactinospora gilvigrisea]|uniref:Type II secretion system protein GspF domain-containing protein n=1 Tax=Mangrovactinospora gilvigrisea TaxID=1428644 RepID=A0A1J7BA22_9ACTN|nr:type II secretion system F family protein [Mangrovactinospora gilvigrisea]OIV35445.1 hypothetical protein BIV57_21500 [Mangrovactinospora gilvigrisea]
MTVTLAFAACGALAALGVVGTVLGATGFLDGTGAARPSTNGPAERLVRWWDGQGDPRLRRVHRVQVLLALVGGIGGWLFTDVVLAVVLVPLAVFGLPLLWASTRPSTIRIERLEALSEWTQRLADVLLLGTGLEQAIVTTRAAAPPRLDREVGELVSRLQARWRPEDALRAFAAELGDATSDKICAALLLRASDRGPGLAGALSDLAESVREEVRQRRAIEADRAKHRATVRWLSVITLGVAVVGAFDRAYTGPYHTALGQAVLVFLTVAFVGIIAWMRNLASAPPLPRLLERDRRSRVGRNEDRARGEGRTGGNGGDGSGDGYGDRYGDGDGGAGL